MVLKTWDQQPGAGGAYTDAAESFMALLDASVKARLARQ
jgi:hypothetical protein